MKQANAAFSDIIRRLRKQAGASQQSAAEAAGITRVTYINLENGRRQPNLNEIIGLAEYFRVAPAVLLGYADAASDTDTISVKPTVGASSFVQDTQLTYKPATSHSRYDKRALTPEHNHVVETVILYILCKLGGHPALTGVTLGQLMWRIDNAYYAKYEAYLTRLVYVDSYYGPIPTAQFETILHTMITDGKIDEVNSRHFKAMTRKYIAVMQPDNKVLMLSQIQCINACIADWQWQMAEV